MNTFQANIRNIIANYIRDLSHGKPRQELKQKAPRDLTPGYIHASNMFDCPRKAAEEQGDTVSRATYPELLKDNLPTMLMRMEQGNRIAEIIQEAIFDEYNNFEACVPEYFLISEELKMMGTADLIIWQEEYNIVELKHRVKTRYGNPEPRIGDIFQLLAYKKMFLEESGLEATLTLGIIDTPAWAEFWDEKNLIHLWFLEPQDNGYVLVNDEGLPWNNYLNDPNFINDATFYSEVERQHLYLMAVEDGRTDITPPFPLHADEAWQCRRIKTKAKDNTLGTFEVICPFYCHDDLVGPTRTYSIEEDGTWKIQTTW